MGSKMLMKAVLKTRTLLNSELICHGNCNMWTQILLMFTRLLHLNVTIDHFCAFLLHFCSRKA